MRKSIYLKCRYCGAEQYVGRSVEVSRFFECKKCCGRNRVEDDDIYMRCDALECNNYLAGTDSEYITCRSLDSLFFFGVPRTIRMFLGAVSKHNLKVRSLDFATRKALCSSNALKKCDNGYYMNVRIVSTISPNPSEEEKVLLEKNLEERFFKDTAPESCKKEDNGCTVGWLKIDHEEGDDPGSEALKYCYFNKKYNYFVIINGYVSIFKEMSALLRDIELGNCLFDKLIQNEPCCNIPN